MWRRSAAGVPYEELRRERTHSSVRHSQEERLPAPEEQLSRKDPQMWALWLGLTALLMAGWATRSPLSCARPVELDFSLCHNVVGDTTGLELPAFCRTGCMRKHSLLLLCTIGVGVLGQCVVVVLNYGEFNNLFRLSWYFDLHDVLPKAEAAWGEGLTAVDEALGSGGGLLGRAMRFVRRPLEAKLDKKAVKLLEAGEKVTKRSVQQVTSAKGASALSTSTYCLSIFMLLRVLLFGLSTEPVHFRCEHDVEKVLQAELNWPIFWGTIGSMALLGLAVSLQANASWAIHIRVKPRDSDDPSLALSLEASEVRSSSEADTPGLNLGVQTGNEEVEKRSAAQRLRDHFKEYQKDGKTIYVPLLTKGLPAPDLLLLKCVPGKKLAGMRYDGALYGADCLHWVLEESRVPRKSGEDVVLLFKSRNPRTWKDRFYKAWGRNPHRAFAMIMLVPACLLLFQASESCWTCIEAININSKITVLELQSRLLLMSACGRHASIGNASMLAGVALLLSVISQAFILSRTRESMAYESQHQEDQMVVPLLDFRQHADLSVTEYEDEEEEEIPDDASEMEEDKEVDVMCYVWARPAWKETEQEARSSTPSRKQMEEEVMNCRNNKGRLPTPQVEEGVVNGAGKIDEMMRPPWQQSRQARKVRLLKVGRERRETMRERIPETGQYSRSSIAIEILNKDGMRQSLPSEDDPHASFQQIVPAEFIAGSFHASLNLGPFEAWEKVSAALAFVAALLAGVDLAFYVWLDGGGLLSSCMDVLTQTSCIYFDVDVTKHAGAYHDRGEDFAFRASAGPLLAGFGGFLAIIAVTALRVANDRERRHRACPLSYCYAFGYSLRIVGRFLRWALMTCPAFVKNCQAYWEPQCGC